MICYVKQKQLRAGLSKVCHIHFRNLGGLKCHRFETYTRYSGVGDEEQKKGH